MPGQLEAPISQGGTNVSGGQRQRLPIARALVKRPEIYVFDDSFSALDVATDARLRAALERETAEAAVIIVGQRVATIADADKIVVLEHGEIVGTGTHRGASRALSDLRRDRRFPAQCRGGRRMSGNGQDRIRPETGAMRPEPVEGRSPGASTSSARSSAAMDSPAPKAPERPKYGPPAGGGGRMWGQARPVEKSLNFLPSLKRLLGHLAPRADDLDPGACCWPSSAL